MAKQPPRILAGQVAAITGGARGIGKETARHLLRQGMKVAIGDLDLTATQAAAAELGPNAKGYALDVTDRASFEAFIDGVEADLGPLDVLVNNAGIMQLGPFLEESDLVAHRQVDINVHGVLYGMKIAVPRFVARGRGHLVNIASSAGKGGFPGGATYCGTKHFVVGVSEALRGELRETPVEVSCVMPGVVNTELASGLTEARGVKNVNPEDVAAAIVECLQVPRFDVFVPKSIGPITQVMGVLPRAGRERITRLLKADQVLSTVDAGARAAYELRASESEPGLKAGDDPKQLSK
ncbi:MAG: SDR family oxidoreductase [Solirubrobacterales bacterium]|nr:SDR family oxidoreductase [Solirubrobacterales bacterium]